MAKTRMLLQFLCIMAYALVAFALTYLIGWLRLGHDHLSHFVEMCFGMSILSNLFFEYKERSIKALKAEVEAEGRKIQLMEEEPVVRGNQAMLQIIQGVKASLPTIQETNVKRQNYWCDVLNAMSLASVIACLFVAFFSWYGNWNVFLALPAPFYFFVAWLFHGRSLLDIAGIRKKIDEYYQAVEMAKTMVPQSQPAPLASAA